MSSALTRLRATAMLPLLPPVTVTVSMPALFLTSLWRLLTMISRGLWQGAGNGLSLRYRALLLLLTPPFLLLWLIHWICLGLDELLFPAYRTIRIHQPVFILGIPRSGTTLLHRALAHHDGFTTLTTWEALLAPSILQRKLIASCRRLDQTVGGPLRWLLKGLQHYGLSRLDDIHAVRLDAPEEDYLLLLLILRCFIQVVPFPQSDDNWQTGRMDESLSTAEKQRVLRFYQRCLQRHLYVHGSDKTLLSKNAAFAGFSESLARHFPDARILVCTREPQQALASQLSSIKPGLAFFGTDSCQPRYRREFSGLYLHFYRHLPFALSQQAAQRHVFIDMTALQQSLYRTVTTALAQLRIPVSDAFLTALRSQDERSRRYRSNHQYSRQAFDSATPLSELSGLFQHHKHLCQAQHPK